MQCGGLRPPHCMFRVSPLYTGLYRARFCPLSPGVQNTNPHLPGQVLRVRIDPQTEGVGKVGGLYPHPGQPVEEIRIAQPPAPTFHIPFPQTGFHFYQVYQGPDARLLSGQLSSLWAISHLFCLREIQSGAISLLGP